MIDVAICSTNTPLATEACLRSLFIYNSDVPMRVRVRAEASCREWAEPLCAELGAEFISGEWQEPHDVGLTRAYLECRENYFLCLDSDIVFQGHGLISDMVNAMEAYPNAYAVGSEVKRSPYPLPEQERFIECHAKNLIVTERCPVHLLMLRRGEVMNRAALNFGFSVAQSNGIPQGKNWDTGGLLFDVMEIAGFSYCQIDGHGSDGADRYHHFTSLSWCGGRYEAIEDRLREIVQELKRK